MSRLDETIADVAHILDCLMAYRNIVASGSCNDCKGASANLPSVQALTEDDLIELRDRFGDGVRFVVEDMISGKGERWK